VKLFVDGHSAKGCIRGFIVERLWAQLDFKCSSCMSWHFERCNNHSLDFTFGLPCGTLDATHPDGQLTPPGPANYSNSNSWYSLVNARTVIGLSQDGRTLFLFTVDAAGGSRGMTVGEIADLLIQDYGVYNALNLDGGGSTTMAMQNPTTGIGGIINVSSDNPNGRAEGSNLAIFATPVPEPSSIAFTCLGLCLCYAMRLRCLKTQ
jgi:Phosphodiester glycosidase